jgi:hypothetical protein
MFDRPPCPFEGRGVVVLGPEFLRRPGMKVLGADLIGGALQQHAGDDVESDALGPPAIHRVGVEPSLGSAPEALLFVRVDGLRSGPVMTESASPSLSPALDLDKDQEWASAGDDVDFHTGGSDVAGNNAIPSLGQVVGSFLLPCAPETLSSFCHVSRFIGTRGLKGAGWARARARGMEEHGCPANFFCA